MKFECLSAASPRKGVGCFSIVRDEIYLLPFFLAHHRALGISFFVFYDDHSTDGTREFLLAQPDCTILTSDRRFNEVVHEGMQLKHYVKNVLPEHYGGGGWFLTLDADEFLIMPERFGKVEELAFYLDRRGLIAVHAAMIGFYPERLSDRHHPLSADPFAVNRWFDRTPSFLRLPHRPIPIPHPGGIRYRLVRMLERRHPDVYRAIFDGGPGRLPFSWKSPLIKTGQGLVRPDAHRLNQRPPLGIELALAHFKFHPHFDGKIEHALETSVYSQNSFEYRLWDAVRRLFPEEPLVGEESVEYLSPSSLETAGLIWAD